MLGMDSTSPLSSMPPGFVRSLKNGRPGLEYGCTKRLGYASLLSSAWDTRSITAGIEYKNSSSSRIRYLFGTDGSGSGGKIGYVNAGAVTEVSTGLSGTARPSFVQCGDLLFFFNGSDAPVVIADTTARQMGITPPSNAPTGAQGTTGSLTQTATYTYGYTFYNAVTGAESSMSALYTVTLTGANDSVDLTLDAGSATTADTIRVYRTYANGNQLFLEGTNAINDTTYTSTIADASLSPTQGEFDNTRITTWSGTPDFPCVAGNRLWLRTGKNEARCSKIGQSGPMFESFPITNVVDTTGTYGAADDLIGIAKAGDRVIFLKQRSIGTADPVGYPDPSQARESQFFLYRELATGVLPASHHAATEVLGECVFLAKDGVYAVNGQEGDRPRQIAPSMATSIASFGFTSAQSVRLSACNDVAKKNVRFQVFSSSAATAPTYTLVGDYANPKLGFRWALDTPGSNSSTHPGVKAGSYFEATDSTSGESLIYFGGVGNGKLYQLNSGTTDDGSAIYYEVIDRPRDGGNPLADKLWQGAGIFASGSGSDYSLTVSSIYDLGTAEEDSMTISLASSGALWDDGEWDVDVWGSDEAKMRDYRTHRKAKYRQLVIRQISATAPVTLFSWYSIGSLFRIY